MANENMPDEPECCEREKTTSDKIKSENCAKNRIDILLLSETYLSKLWIVTLA